ncbi:MAG: penicillin-binding protein 2 [Oscillospiraceae bacterium]|jgi:cell division protein FtsI/penicillin-binding protein 2|nr:penicillin-binding protein 2 [Oscillospiraceae bacterium]
MKKRVTIFFFILISAICFAVFNLYFLSQLDWLQSAATIQHFNKLKVGTIRGNIYDCNKVPLVNTEKDKIAAIMPSVKTNKELKKAFSSEKMKEILPRLSKLEPFCLKIPYYMGDIPGVDIFDVPKRYSYNQICPHIIGYVNDSGEEGICGIEKSYNDFFYDCFGEISVRYDANAKGGMLGEKNREIKDTSYMKNRGVVLTIDQKIQEITQISMEKHVKKGAALVVEIPNSEIRSCVSLPNFSPNNLENALKNPDCPLINRAFSEYNVGSIFKLVTAAAALEYGIPSSFKFNCTGNIDVNSINIDCFGGFGHGQVDMKEAMKHSCNGYFVKLAERFPPEKILNLSSKLGFGETQEFAPYVFSSKGNLPSLDELKNKVSLANFSFGQGFLMATPVQIISLINTIASEGNYIKPSLIKGLVNESLDFTEEIEQMKPEKILSNRTTKILKEQMKASLMGGTSFAGKPSKISAAAKTSTSQTGIINNEGHKVLQAWFGGFFPYENPKYAVVVLAEDAESGGRDCGPVFVEIADKITDLKKL